ncbi:hypothetical protein [Exiguobacterium antarcticum]|uniref:hypothetical protein n=1 Tax=Exiguobacterium antarcticum TaxID=132920 RepID=UPI0002E108AD|nr:hypothetical protein [Exiguobacterium antarcticum]
MKLSKHDQRKNRQEEQRTTFPPRSSRIEHVRNERFKQPFAKNRLAITLTVLMITIIIAFVSIGFMM